MRQSVDDDEVYSLCATDSDVTHRLEICSDSDSIGSLDQIDLDAASGEHLCDHNDYACDIIRLRRRNRVLYTLSGMQIFERVVNSAIAIQVAYRRLRLQRRAWLMVVGIQQVVRGWLVRRTPLGRSVAHLITRRRETLALEVFLLRLCDSQRVATTTRREKVPHSNHDASSLLMAYVWQLNCSLR